MKEEYFNIKEEQIEQLLQRYLDAETTPEEESALRRYFASGNYPARLSHYALLFTAFEEELPPLSDVERDETLNLCPPPRQIQRRTARLMRYAAVWIFGIFFGSIMVRLAQPAPAPATSAPQETAMAEVTTKTDTVYHEHIVTQRDTVYILKHLPPQQPANTAENTREKNEEHDEVPAPPQYDFPRNAAHNLAVLAAR